MLNAKAQREIQLTARKGNQQEIDTLRKEISALEESISKCKQQFEERVLLTPHSLNLGLWGSTRFNSS